MKGKGLERIRSFRSEHCLVLPGGDDENGNPTFNVFIIPSNLLSYSTDALIALIVQEGGLIPNGKIKKLEDCHIVAGNGSLVKDPLYMFIDVNKHAAELAKDISIFINSCRNL